MSKELIERLKQRIQIRRGMNGGRIDANTKDMQESIAAIEAIAAERDALAAELKAAREQEPVATYKGHRHIPSDTKEFWGMADSHLPAGTHLYARPVPAYELTDEAIENLHMQVYKGPSIAPVRMLSFARAIERHLKGEGE